MTDLDDIISSAKKEKRDNTVVRCRMPCLNGFDGVCQKREIMIGFDIGENGCCSSFICRPSCRVDRRWT